MDEDEERRGEGKRERRSLALSTGPAYWRALRGDHTPLLDRGCLCFAILAVRQPAPASKTRGDRRGEGGRKLWKFRTRIVRESESWKLCDPFIVEMSRNSIKIEKMGRGGFFFFLRVLITRVEKERITNRILNIIVKCSERTLFPVYFYMLLFVWGWIRKLIQSYYIIIIIIIHLLLIWEKVNVWWCLMYHESIE